MSDRRLDDLEAEASLITNGFYWTMEWCATMVVCYCMMGLLGVILIATAVVSPALWIAVAVYYIAWFWIIPRAWRRHAAQSIIDKYRSKQRYW